ASPSDIIISGTVVENRADYREKAFARKREPPASHAGAATHNRSSSHRAGGRSQRVETRLLLVAQPVVEFGKGGLHGVHRLKRGAEAPLHGLDPAGRRERLVARAVGLECLGGLGGGIAQFVERAALLRRRPHGLGDAVDRQVGHSWGALVAILGEVLLLRRAGIGGAGVASRRDRVEARLLLVG